VDAGRSIAGWDLVTQHKVAPDLVLLVFQSLMSTRPAFSLDFYREELLHGLLRSDPVRVARLIGDYLVIHFLALRNFRNARANPDGTIAAALALGSELRAFV